MSRYYWQYGTIGALAILGSLFVAIAFNFNRLMRPHNPRPDKYTTYECGMDPVGEGWSQTQIRYYIFAFLFVIFDVESVFLFPWAVVFEKIANHTQVLVEMIIFVLILAVGLLYAYKKKVLDWDTPSQAARRFAARPDALGGGSLNPTTQQKAMTGGER